MIKLVTLLAVALVSATSTSALAQMDCDRQARVVVDQLRPTEDADPLSMNTPDMIHVTRFTTLGYDACKAGKHEMARQHFESARQHISKMRNGTSG